MKGILIVLPIIIAVAAAVPGAQKIPPPPRPGGTSLDRQAKLPPTKTRRGERPDRLRSFNPSKHRVDASGRITFHAKADSHGSSGLSAPRYAHPAVLSRPESAKQPNVNSNSGQTLVKNQEPVIAGRLSQSQSSQSAGTASSSAGKEQVQGTGPRFSYLTSSRGGQEQAAAQSLQDQRNARNRQEQATPQEPAQNSQGGTISQGFQSKGSLQDSHGQTAQSGSQSQGSKQGSQGTQGQGLLQEFQGQTVAKGTDGKDFAQSSKGQVGTRGTQGQDTLYEYQSSSFTKISQGQNIQGKSGAPGSQIKEASQTSSSVASGTAQSGQQRSQYIAFGTDLVGSSTFQKRTRFESSQSSQSGGYPSTKTKSADSGARSPPDQSGRRRTAGIPVSQVAAGSWSGSSNPKDTQALINSRPSPSSSNQERGQQRPIVGTQGNKPAGHRSQSASGSTGTGSSSVNAQGSTKAFEQAQPKEGPQKAKSAAQISGPLNRVPSQNFVSGSSPGESTQTGIYRPAGRLGPLMPPTRTRHVSSVSRTSPANTPYSSISDIDSQTASASGSRAKTSVQDTYSYNGAQATPQNQRQGNPNEPVGSQGKQGNSYVPGSSSQLRSSSSTGPIDPSSSTGSNTGTQTKTSSGQSLSSGQNASPARPPTKTKTGPSPFKRQNTAGSGSGGNGGNPKAEKEPLDREGGQGSRRSGSGNAGRTNLRKITHPEVLRRPESALSSQRSSSGQSGNGGGSGYGGNGGAGSNGNGGNGISGNGRNKGTRSSGGSGNGSAGYNGNRGPGSNGNTGNGGQGGRNGGSWSNGNAGNGGQGSGNGGSWSNGNAGNGGQGSGNGGSWSNGNNGNEGQGSGNGGSWSNGNAGNGGQGGGNGGSWSNGNAGNGGQGGGNGGSWSNGNAGNDGQGGGNGGSWSNGNAGNGGQGSGSGGSWSNGNAGNGGQGGNVDWNNFGTGGNFYDKPCSSNPVCATDGYTYLSDCYLRAGLEKACDGFCPCKGPPPPPRPAALPPTDRPVRYEPVPCKCPLTYEPVCGTNGITYDNNCQRKCKHATLACFGECPCYDPPLDPEPVSCESSCSNAYMPVCGASGYTYENECMMDCSFDPKECDGECPCPQDTYTYTDLNNEPSNQPLSTCECMPNDIDPICTKDNVTILYGCEAICLGVEMACSSKCPC